MPLALPRFRFHALVMYAKFVFILLFFLYVYKCVSVSPPPSTTFMRSEPLVIRLEIGITSILPLTLLCVCMMHILSRIDLNCRFITFDTRLNMLTDSAKKRRLDNLYFLLVLSYFIIFDYYFVVFLPLNLRISEGLKK